MGTRCGVFNVVDSVGRFKIEHVPESRGRIARLDRIDFVVLDELSYP